MIPLIAKKEIAQERYRICKSCEELSAAKTCKKCNCFMPVKVKLAHAWCPKEKWLSKMDPREHQTDAYEDLE